MQHARIIFCLPLLLPLSMGLGGECHFFQKFKSKMNLRQKWISNTCFTQIWYPIHEKKHWEAIAPFTPLRVIKTPWCSLLLIISKIWRIRNISGDIVYSWRDRDREQRGDKGSCVQLAIYVLVIMYIERALLFFKYPTTDSLQRQRKWKGKKTTKRKLSCMSKKSWFILLVR